MDYLGKSNDFEYCCNYITDESEDLSAEVEDLAQEFRSKASELVDILQQYTPRAIKIKVCISLKKNIFIKLYFVYRISLTHYLITHYLIFLHLLLKLQLMKNWRY